MTAKRQCKGETFSLIMRIVVPSLAGFRFVFHFCSAMRVQGIRQASDSNNGALTHHTIYIFLVDFGTIGTITKGRVFKEELYRKWAGVNVIGSLQQSGR